MSRFHAPDSFPFGQSFYQQRFRRFSANVSLPFPFFGDSFNPDDVYSTGYPVASQPPALVLQIARAMAGSPEYPVSSQGPSKDHRDYPTAQPLMIELHNGRYVRIQSTPSNGEVLPPNLRPDAQPARSSAVHSNPAAAITASSTNLPPALLIFRDGHTEEVRDYTIADGTLYARGDYYTDGYWNKKIDLSTLNVTETLQANATRSVKFILPKSPNEVITRP